MGGWFPQSSDWIKHNAVLNDLVNLSWPVYYTNATDPSMLTYYLGQYLVPAVFGKILSSFRVAEVMMYIWGEIGLFLIILNLYMLLKASTLKKQIAVIFIFVFFSGCLIISQNFFGIISGITETNTRWMNTEYHLQYRNNFVDLRWVMPQCIAVWLIICLWWNNKQRIEFYVPLMLPAMLNGAIPFLGLVIISVLCAFFEMIQNKSLFNILKKAFSIQNILTFILLGIPLLFYFSGNVLSKKDIDSSFAIQHLGFWLYFSLVVGHVVIYIFPTWKFYRKNGIYLASIVLLLLLPFFKLGYYNDLLMSGSIPGMFVLNICVMDILLNYPKTFQSGFLSLAVMIGALNPSKEIYSIVNKNNIGVLDHQISLDSLAEHSDLENGNKSYKYNYYTYDISNNIFIKYLAQNSWNTNEGEN